MSMKYYTSVHLIFVPYHVGIYNHRVGAGPTALREHGLGTKLSALKLKVTSTEISPVDDFEGDIGKSFEVFRRVSAAMSEARENNAFPVVLAGNCNVTVGISAGLDIPREELGCVWFDAHADFDTPSTMTGGYFDGLGVSMLAGESWHALLESIPGFRPLDLDRVIMCGTRDVSDSQREKVERSKLGVVWGGKHGTVEYDNELEKLVEERRIGLSMVHFDIDCLDAELYGKFNDYAAPDGLLERDLVGCLEMLASKTTPVSLSFASLSPGMEGGEAGTKIAIDAITAFLKTLCERGIVVREA